MSIIHNRHFDNVCSNGSEEGTGENGMEGERGRGESMKGGEGRNKREIG